MSENRRLNHLRSGVQKLQLSPSEFVHYDYRTTFIGAYLRHLDMAEADFIDAARGLHPRDPLWELSQDLRQLVALTRQRITEIPDDD